MHGSTAHDSLRSSFTSDRTGEVVPDGTDTPPLDAAALLVQTAPAVLGSARRAPPALETVVEVSDVLAVVRASPSNGPVPAASAVLAARDVGVYLEDIMEAGDVDGLTGPQPFAEPGVPSAAVTAPQAGPERRGSSRGRGWAALLGCFGAGALPVDGGAEVLGAGYASASPSAGPRDASLAASSRAETPRAASSRAETPRAAVSPAASPRAVALPPAAAQPRLRSSSHARGFELPVPAALVGSGLRVSVAVGWPAEERSSSTPRRTPRSGQSALRAPLADAVLSPR